jgi:hypothetical protein
LRKLRKRKREAGAGEMVIDPLFAQFLLLWPVAFSAPYFGKNPNYALVMIVYFEVGWFIC